MYLLHNVVQQRNCKKNTMQNVNKSANTATVSNALQKAMQDEYEHGQANKLANSISCAIIDALHNAKQDNAFVQQLTAQAAATKQSKAIKFRILQLQHVQNKNNIVLLQEQFKKWEKANAFVTKNNLQFAIVVNV